MSLFYYMTGLEKMSFPGRRSRCAVTPGRRTHTRHTAKSRPVVRGAAFRRAALTAAVILAVVLALILVRTVLGLVVSVHILISVSVAVLRISGAVVLHILIISVCHNHYLLTEFGYEVSMAFSL